MFFLSTYSWILSGWNIYYLLLFVSFFDCLLVWLVVFLLESLYLWYLHLLTQLTVQKATACLVSFWRGRVGLFPKPCMEVVALSISSQSKQAVTDQLNSVNTSSFICDWLFKQDSCQFFDRAFDFETWHVIRLRKSFKRSFHGDNDSIQKRSVYMNKTVWCCKYKTMNKKYYKK